MAGTIVLGRLAIRVAPDTDFFRAELLKEVESAERNIKAEIPVGIEDTSRLKEEVKNLCREITALSKTDPAYQIRLQARMDDRRFKTDLRRVTKQAKNVTVRPVLDKPSLEHVKEQLLRFRKDENGKSISVNIHSDIANASRKKAQLSLSILTRDRLVTIIPKVSKSAAAKAAAAIAALSGARSFHNLSHDLIDWAANLDKAIPMMTIWVGLITTLIDLVGNLTTNIFALGKNLAEIFPILLAAPGVLGGLAIGLIATVAALSEFNKRLPNVVSRFKRLKSLIADNFWKEAQKPFEEFFRVILPGVEKGMADASTEMGKFFGIFAKSLKGKFSKDLDEMFDNFSKSIRIAQGAATDLATIINVLGSEGAKYLPRLAGWFDDVASSFANWLETNKKNGGLDAWVETGIQALKDFGHALAGFGRFFRALGRIADESGGSDLRALGDGLNHIAHIMDTEPFHSKAVKTFKAMRKAISNLMEKAGPGLENFFSSLSTQMINLLPMLGTGFGTALGNVADAISDFPFQNGLTRFVTGISNALVDLKPALRDATDTFGDLMHIVGTLAEDFTGPLNAGFGILKDVLHGLKPYLESSGGTLSDSLTDFFEMIGPALKDLSPKVGKIIQAVADAIGDIVDSLKKWKTKKALKDFIDSIDSQDVEDIATALGDLGAAVAPIVPFLLEMASGVVKGGIEALGDLARNLDDLANATQKYENTGGVKAPSLVEWGATIGESLAHIVKAAVLIIPHALKTIWRVLSRSLKDIYDGLGDGLYDAIILPFVDLFNGSSVTEIINAWTGGTSELILAIVKNLGDVVLIIVQELIRFVREVFHDLGFDAVAGWMKGIEDKIGSAKAWWDKQWQKWIDWVKDLFGIHSPSTVFIQIGKDVIQGFINGVKSLVGAALRVLRKFGSSVLNVFSGLGRSVESAWGKAVDWVKAQTRGLSRDARSLISRMASGIESRFRTLSSRAVSTVRRMGSRLRSVFRSAGSSAESMASAIERGIEHALSILRGFASRASRAVGGLGGVLYWSGQQLVGGLIHGINSMMGALSRKMSDLARRSRDVTNRELSIASPSKVFARIGMWIMKGLLQGLERNYDPVENYMREAANGIASLGFASPGVQGEAVGKRNARRAGSAMADAASLPSQIPTTTYATLEGAHLRVDVDNGTGFIKDGLLKINHERG